MKLSIEFHRAQLRTVHNYGKTRAVENTVSTPGCGTPYRITYTDAESGAEEINKSYYKGNRYHNRWCVGDDCERTLYPEKTERTMTFDRYLGSGTLYNGPDYTLYFYRWECAECGYQDLYWYAEPKTDIV